MGAAAVEAYLHETVAPKLLGRDPLQIEAINAALAELPRLALAPASRRAATRRSTSRCGTCSARRTAGRSPTCWAAARATRSASTTPAPATSTSATRARRRSPTGTSARTGGPYEDLDAFLHRADELALSLLEQGITGMKIWPFDIAAERTRRLDISPAELDTALEPFRKIRTRGRRPDGHHGRVPLAVEPADGQEARRAAGRVRHLLARGPVPPRQHRRPRRLRAAQQGVGLRVRDARLHALVPRVPRRPASPAS